MIKLTRDQIKSIAPKAHERAVEALVNGADVLASAGVNSSKLRLAHALAQWAFETNGFVEWSENLHYSAQRLLQVFPRYFTQETATRAALDGPEAIANIVYDDLNPARRNKLGNVHNGDGWRFRGRGVMHTTGREGYARATAVTGVDLIADPDKLSDPALSLVVACRYWADRGCNAKADADDIEGVTKIINGGLNGLEGRREYLAKAKKALSGAAEVPAAIPTPPTPKPASVEAAKEPDAMSDLKPFLPLIEQFAPTIGGMIFGAPGAKLAPLAVAGIHALADALDGEEPTPAAIAGKLSTMPSEAVPAALQAAESAVKGSLPQVALPAPVTPPAPAQGLYVDPVNSLIKLGVAAAAAAFAAKFGIDAATAQSVGDMAVPILQGLVTLVMGGLSGFSLWRSIAGSNANTAASFKA